MLYFQFYNTTKNIIVIKLKMRTFNREKDPLNKPNIFTRKPIFAESSMANSKIWCRDSMSMRLHDGDEACQNQFRANEEIENQKQNVSIASKQQVLPSREYASVKIEPRKLWARESSSDDEEQYRDKLYGYQLPQTIIKSGGQNDRHKSMIFEYINSKSEIRENPNATETNSQASTLINRIKTEESQVEEKVYVQVQNKVSEISDKDHLQLVKQQRQLLEKSAELDRKVEQMGLQNKILLEQHFLHVQVLISNRKKLNSLENMKQLEIANIDYKRKLFEVRQNVQKLVQKEQGLANQQLIGQLLQILSF